MIVLKLFPTQNAFSILFAVKCKGRDTNHTDRMVRYNDNRGVTVLIQAPIDGMIGKILVLNTHFYSY